MEGFAWDPDRFGSELAETLTVALEEMRDTAALAIAVAQCAATAEAASSGRAMACAAGCPHCCVLNVAILLPEGMLIADWMRERLTPSELEELHKRLRVHRFWGRWMDDEERIAKQVHCPMVDAAGSCMIHPVRPLACRGVTSLDSASCREALAPGVHDDETRAVPTDLLRRAAYDEGFSALCRALRSHGLDDRSIELGCGVLAFLEHPESRELFLGGGKLPRDLWL